MAETAALSFALLTVPASGPSTPYSRTKSATSDSQSSGFKRVSSACISSCCDEMERAAVATGTTDANASTVALSNLCSAAASVTAAAAVPSAADPAAAAPHRFCRRGERGRSPLPDRGGCCIASRRLNLPAQGNLQAGQLDQLYLQHQGDRREQRRGRDARRPAKDRALQTRGRLQPHPAGAEPRQREGDSRRRCVRFLHRRRRDHRVDRAGLPC